MDFLRCHSDRREESASGGQWFNHHRHFQLPAVLSPLSFRPKGGICLRPAKRYYVYIMASKSRTLYVGVTGFLMARIMQHKTAEIDSFTKRYRINRLVYYECFQYVNNALARETELKKWRRDKKVALIATTNPTWEDLAADWGNRSTPPKADSSLRSE